MKPGSLQTDRTKTCHKAAVTWRQTACQTQSAYLHSSRLSKVYSAATASTYWRGCSTDLLLPPSAFSLQLRQKGTTTLQVEIFGEDVNYEECTDKNRPNLPGMKISSIGDNF